MIWISETPIDAATLLEGVNDPAYGASVLFLGIVRNYNQGRSVEAVSYDAFIPLARQIFFQICSEAREKWDAQMKIALAHRVGRLQVGEVSVGIAVGSRHRDEAYLASRYVIEELKVRAPIWKKEHYHDGESEWLQGHALCSHSHRSSGRSIHSHGH